MTRTRSIITGAVAAAAVTGTIAAIATNVDAAAGTPSAGTFTVRAHHVSESNIDLGRSGLSAGDEDLFVDRLTRNGQRVGYLAGSCTSVRVGPASEDQLCEFALHLGKSQITASGSVRARKSGPGTFTIPILGGTGRYLGVGGQIAITATNRPSLPITISLDR
jgi:hypothetical protein